LKRLAYSHPVNGSARDDALVVTRGKELDWPAFPDRKDAQERVLELVSSVQMRGSGAFERSLSITRYQIGNYRPLVVDGHLIILLSASVGL